MSDENKEIVAKVNEAFRAANCEAFLDYCDEGVQWTLIGDVTKQGKESIREWMKSMPDHEPPKFTVEDPVIAEGDFVVARGEMTMKDKKGKPTHYDYCDVYRFRDNKIVELTSFVVKTTQKKQAVT